MSRINLYSTAITSLSFIVASASATPNKVVAPQISKALLEYSNPEVYAFISFGQSQIVLGSEDSRIGTITGLEWVRPDRFLRNFGDNVVSTLSVYAMAHRSVLPEYQGQSTVGIGVTYSARFYDRSRRGPKWYAQVGWGLQTADAKSNDLDSEINSTPYARIGILTKAFGRRIDIAGEYFHLSNGGTKGRNLGQNFLLFYLGFRL